MLLDVILSAHCGCTRQVLCLVKQACGEWYDFFFFHIFSDRISAYLSYLDHG